MLYKCITSNTSAIWQHAEHTTDQLTSPSCWTGAIAPKKKKKKKKTTQKCLSINEKYWRIFWKKFRRTSRQKKKRQKGQQDYAEQESRQQSGIKWQPWDSRHKGDIRHPRTPFGVDKCGHTDRNLRLVDYEYWPTQLCRSKNVRYDSLGVPYMTRSWKGPTSVVALTTVRWAARWGRTWKEWSSWRRGWSITMWKWNLVSSNGTPVEMCPSEQARATRMSGDYNRQEP